MSDVPSEIEILAKNTALAQADFDTQVKQMKAAEDQIKENWKKVGKGFLIAFGSFALTWAADNYTSIDFGKYTPQVQAALAVVIVMIKEYFKTRPELEEIDSLPTDGYDD